MSDAIERLDPPVQGPERSQLDAWLDYHRATLLVKCEGLTDEQLKLRSCEPSTLSLLGLVRHLTEVERGWFRRTLVDEDVSPIYYSTAEPDGDFDLLDDTDVATVFARYRDEVATSRRIAAGFDDVNVVAARPDWGREVDLRWIYLHMIEEYARHNGHADLIRQRIDGVTGE